MVHMYIGTMYVVIKRNKCESAVLRWMNLEPVTPSEVSLILVKRKKIVCYIWNLLP